MPKPCKTSRDSKGRCRSKKAHHSHKYPKRAPNGKCSYGRRNGKCMSKKYSRDNAARRIQSAMKRRFSRK